jgi:hypothetical protein
MRQFFLLVTLALFLAGSLSGHTAESPSEYQVKTAYLYNFAKFIHWPDSAFSDAKAPLVIGVLGNNPFNGLLKQLESKTVHNRPIKIKYFKSVKDVLNCQLLYIYPSESNELVEILKVLRTKPIITVSEANTFAEQGGVIQLVTKRGRLRFVFNLEVTKANDIKVDSQLLNLAADVLGVEQ